MSPNPRNARFALLFLATACARHATSAPAPRAARPLPPAVVHSAPVAASSVSALAAEIIQRTNEQRTAAHIAKLATSALLVRAAQIQADQMAAAGVMAHEIPSARYPTMRSRAEAVGYRIHTLGENVAAGYPTPALAVRGWMESSGHRANILSTHYTEIGAAVATSKDGRPYYAQVFGSAY